MQKEHSNLIGRRLIAHDALASFEFTHFFNPVQTKEIGVQVA
jgi:hypothetical protein